MLLHEGKQAIRLRTHIGPQLCKHITMSIRTQASMSSPFGRLLTFALPAIHHWSGSNIEKDILPIVSLPCLYTEWQVVWQARLMRHNIVTRVRDKYNLSATTCTWWWSPRRQHDLDQMIPHMMLSYKKSLTAQLGCVLKEPLPGKRLY